MAKRLIASSSGRPLKRVAKKSAAGAAPPQATGQPTTGLDTDGSKNTSDRPQVELYTDGACTGNPGPGGWGFILRDPATGKEKEGSGGDAQTTNNRMELLSVIEGLRSLRKPATVRVVSDSQYVVNGLREWLDGWKAKGWRKADKSPVLNRELWEELDRLRQIHELRPEWVRGHRGHEFNERCDRLAVAAIEQFRRR
jgi:ribonuclease HI